MRIRVKTLMRRTFGLDVHPSASIDEVKAILTQATTPLPCPQASSPHDPTLLGVLSRPTILGQILPASLAPGTPGPQPHFLPFGKLQPWVSLEAHVWQNDCCSLSRALDPDSLSVRDQETGIPLAGQRLVYKGEVLGSGSVSECGVNDDDFLVVVVVDYPPASHRNWALQSLPQEHNPPLSPRTRLENT